MSKSAVIGVCRTSGGSPSSRCSQRVTRPLWGAIGLAWRIARPWMPSSRSCAPGARDRPGMIPAAGPGALPLVAATRGRWPGVCLALWRRGGRTDEAGAGRAWAWLARDGARPQAPRGGETRGQAPPDRGQRGTKRRVHTDGGGVPIGLAVEGTQRQTFPRAPEPIGRLPVARPAPTLAQPQGRCLETGDDNDAGRDLRAEVGCTALIHARVEEATALTQEAGITARRWVVERTQRGRPRIRRLLIRWDQTARHALGWWPWACAWMTYQQSGLLG
jgi:putative transposase